MLEELALHIAYCVNVLERLLANAVILVDRLILSCINCIVDLLEIVSAELFADLLEFTENTYILLAVISSFVLDPVLRIEIFDLSVLNVAVARSTSALLIDLVICFVICLKLVEYKNT